MSGPGGARRSGIFGPVRLWATVYGQVPYLREQKTNKEEKNSLLRFVTTCDSLEGCVGSGKIW